MSDETTANAARLAALPSVKVRMENGTVITVVARCRTKAQCDEIAAKYPPDGIVPIAIVRGLSDSKLSTPAERAWLATTALQRSGELGAELEATPTPVKVVRQASAVAVSRAAPPVAAKPSVNKAPRT